MAAPLQYGRLVISGITFNVPLDNNVQVELYFVPGMPAALYQQYQKTQAYFRRKGLPPLTTVTYDNGTRAFWAYSDDRSVGLVYTPPDTFQVIANRKSGPLPTLVEELSKMTIPQLKQYAADNDILPFPSALTKEGLVFFINQTIVKMEERRANPLVINCYQFFLQSSAVLKRILEDFIYFFVRYYHVRIDIKNPDSRVVLIELEQLGLIRIDMSQISMDDANQMLADIIKELRRLYNIEYAKEETVPQFIDKKLDKKANSAFYFNMEDPIVKGCPGTYQQLGTMIRPDAAFKDIYTRWEVMADKQAALQLMYQILQCKNKTDSYIYNDHNRTLYIIHTILNRSINPNLTSKVDSEKDNRFLFQILLQTASNLAQVGPNQTLSNKKSDGSSLMDPEDPTRMLSWRKYIYIVVNFILLLPQPVQVNWAESYLKSFIEGYDLKVDAIPVCRPGLVPVFGIPVTPGTQQYASCYLGMCYHMLISLYQVLFEGYQPKPVKPNPKNPIIVVQQAPVQHIEQPVFYYNSIITSKIQEFQVEFIQKYNITEDFTEEQKELFKEEFFGYFLSLPVTHDDHNWEPQINTIVDGVLEFLGKRGRMRNSRKRKGRNTKGRKGRNTRNTMKRMKSRSATRQ